VAYREQLRDILDRKQPNVVHSMLWQWCSNVMRSKVEPMKEVAMLVRRHFDGIVAWSRTRQTNGFIEALNGLFQAAKRKARGYTRYNDAHRTIPDRGKTGLRESQPASEVRPPSSVAETSVTHSGFERGVILNVALRSKGNTMLPHDNGIGCHGMLLLVS
jgi:hypothetical protein